MSRTEAIAAIVDRLDAVIAHQRTALCASVHGGDLTADDADVVIALQDAELRPLIELLDAWIWTIGRTVH